MGVLLVAEMAGADLAGIGDPAVIAELLDLAERELLIPPRQSPDEGYLANNISIYWRRGIRVEQSGDADAPLAYDLEDDNCLERARDYRLLYREPTKDEYADGNMQGETYRIALARVFHINRYPSLFLGAT